MQTYVNPNRPRPQLPQALLDLQTPLNYAFLRGRDIVIPHCVVCGKRHVHGLAGERPGSVVHREAHCLRASGSYNIVLGAA